MEYQYVEKTPATSTRFHRKFYTPTDKTSRAIDAQSVNGGETRSQFSSAMGVTATRSSFIRRPSSIFSRVALALLDIGLDRPTEGSP
jgi:hypothetical protein